MMIWRFRRLISAYGADPGRWPPGQRSRAEALLARSPKARALLGYHPQTHVREGLARLWDWYRREIAG